jgi:ATP-binding cassette, subfamily B, bacterial
MSTSYKLSNIDTTEEDKVDSRSFFGILGLLRGEIVPFTAAIVFILINSAATIAAPRFLGEAVDKLIVDRDMQIILQYALLLLGIYLVGTVANYIEIMLMGGVGQRVLFKLRAKLFQQLQDLPIAFFNQNKAGDLISRLNNDTEKLNNFFSEGLVQLIGNTVTMIGVALTMLVVQPKLGAVALSPIVALFFFTLVAIRIMRYRTRINLKALGDLSAEIQQSLENFKVIVAFNRRDYFRTRFTEVNYKNYRAALASGLANILNAPMYDFANNLATLLTVVFALTMIMNGEVQVGILISYLAYVGQFYGPLRYMSSIWSMMQTAIAAWGRISEILSLKSNLPVLKAEEVEGATEQKSKALLQFKSVSFTYPEGVKVLTDNSITLEAGKTYALVGPTGGGKTTTAGLIARLFDASEGEVLLQGRDIRTYTPEERTDMIGFILQEPFLFAGTLQENIIYGNNLYKGLNAEEIKAKLDKLELGTLLKGFSEGLESKIEANAGNLSLGQKQIVAFVRAVLREPKLLILDEATANLDTVTEQVLQDIIDKLPSDTSKVIIAHRLNTIVGADEIFFINGGRIEAAGSLQEAINMLEQGQKSS